LSGFYSLLSKAVFFEGLRRYGRMPFPMQRRVTEAMNSQLLREFTVEEINGVLMQMLPLKAPCPDGFAACFYQENWATVGTEVCNTILGILNSGSINNELNSTYIALVPKVKNPCKVSAFRLISLCNVLYKIASKVLANRLKEVIPNVISYISRVLLFLGVLFLITFWWLMKHFILYKLGCGVRMAIWH
jgi:hypothetical protein